MHVTYGLFIHKRGRNDRLLKKYTWNLLYVYINAHNQILIDECPGDGVQDIPILHPQCADMNFSYQIRFNRMLKKVVNKGGYSEINYIKIFQNTKALEI